MKNKTGDGIKTNNANWKFSGSVVKKFDNHIARSVPYYKEGQKLVVISVIILLKRLFVLRIRMFDWYTY